VDETRPSPFHEQMNDDDVPEGHFDASFKPSSGMHVGKVCLMDMIAFNLEPYIFSIT
jgi:hypothetical protein